MSLNIPSSLFVNCDPHSAFNFEIIDFSASIEPERPSNWRCMQNQVNSSNFVCRRLHR
jgi:hypothetical protein|eukprot:COSAG01_NODE_3871_length_5604_cov_15.632334_6_plen_58_part_00